MKFSEIRVATHSAPPSHLGRGAGSAWNRRNQHPNEINRLGVLDTDSCRLYLRLPKAIQP